MPAVPVMRLPFPLTETSVLAIIPARYHSTRLPGKPLADLDGRPMIAHVYERARQASLVDAVVVATDDGRVAAAVQDAGGVAVMTAPTHPSGTDRLAEVCAGVPCEIVVNVQGDEPMLDPSVIDGVVRVLREEPVVGMATAARPSRTADELANPNMVKVVCDAQGFALYFSRAPIPFDRDGRATAGGRIHIGLYGYRRETLLRLARLPVSPLERSEALEQLRALEHGIRIRVIETGYQSAEVNTPEDLEHVRKQLRHGKASD